MAQYEARRVLRMPSSVVYSYLTEVHRNRCAASLLGGRTAEAEYVCLLLGALLSAVQSDPAGCFAHDQLMRACAGQGALLRVLWVLVGQ